MYPPQRRTLLDMIEAFTGLFCGHSADLPNRPPLRARPWSLLASLTISPITANNCGSLSDGPIARCGRGLLMRWQAAVATP